MIEKLEAIKQKFYEVNDKLADPNVISDIQGYRELMKGHKDLEKIVFVYGQYNKVLSDMRSAKNILISEKDGGFRDMAKEELEMLSQTKTKLENDLKVMLMPKDLTDSKNVILEIKAGTGGDEAAVFVGDLFRMYKRFAENMRWQFNLIDYTEGSSGGYKEIICNLSGESVYGMMKYESGVHRVQRVPSTESQGRIHTSAVSVVVLPEAEELEVNINMNEVRKDTFCSSGPGGQSVNTTHSAIRLTHMPTGIVVSCQDEKSQIKNLEKALKVLRSRIYDKEIAKRQQALGAEKKSIIKNNDRSDKIRTYNYPQNRVTEHRIGYTSHKLTSMLDGKLADIIETLTIADTAKKIQEGSF